MGSMWIDPDDARIYPVDPDQKPLPFDPSYLVLATEFPPSRWGSDYQAMLALIEFMATGWQEKIIIDPPPFPGSDAMMKELEYLVDRQIDRRQSAMQEILAQNHDFQSYMVAQLSVSPRTHPKTYLMLKMAARIGEVVMVYLKSQHNAVRPSQVYPRLFPPVPVAPHATYPSGHSLVAYMMAFTAVAIVPAMGDAPRALASRIAINREIAGLHFPSDTVAGADAAAQAFNLFKTIPWFQTTQPLAVWEWT